MVDFMPEANITYKLDLTNVDWVAMRDILTTDHFHNGRTPAQLQTSFANSYATCLAYQGDQLIGTVRALSDGVCNAYIVDVWTLSAFRKQGVATKMMELVLAQLTGQHVYLFTDDAVGFYKTLGFVEQDVGLGKVMGEWLQPTTP
jgi:ribosomal protein S18 acetylase RimI-like enzyme